MSFSDRRRDGGEERGVKGKYILRVVIVAEIVKPDAIPVTNQS